MRTKRLLPTVAVAAALLLTGCSSGNEASTVPSGAPGGASSQSASSGPFNQADVSFAQQMIPHHAQALAMATLAAGRTNTPATLELADRIRGEQQPEIDQLNGYLTSWGAPVAQAGGAMPGMDHGQGHGSPSGPTMPGMMTEQEMTALRSLTGAAFDRRWLQMMTSHHQGAIVMAQTELSQGVNPQAKQLATGIIAAQQAEIEQMALLLKQS